MKKFLVLVLALAMVFAFATTAFAADTEIPDYSDVNENTEFASDIYRLTALGVLEGNTGWGGAYRPTELLTRAEFAKIVVYLNGEEDKVDYYAALPSTFSDVYNGYWAEGYINLCNDLGLMVGRVAGVIFDPTAYVTTQEVATAVLRAVGYDDNLPGAWPKDYITKADEVISFNADETLFDYVRGIGANPATRAQMAAIANYALDLYRVDYVADGYNLVYGISDVDKDGYAYDQWATNEEDFFDRMGWTMHPEQVTLLWYVFNAHALPVDFCDYDYDRTNNDYDLKEAHAWGYEDFAKGELVLCDDLWDAYWDLAANYYIFNADLWELSNQYGTMTVKVTENFRTSEVVFVDLASDVEYVANAKVTFGAQGDTYTETVTNADVYYSAEGVAYDVYDYDWFKDLEFAIVDGITSDIVSLDNGYDLCILDGCKTHTDDYVVLKDGALVDGDALAVNDIVYYAGYLCGDDNVELYIAYTPEAATFEELASLQNSEIEIDGVDYKYNTRASMWSDDNGYPGADSFAPMNGAYADLRAILTNDDYNGACLFAEAYAKTYAGALIIDWVKDPVYNYGVVTGFGTEWVRASANSNVAVLEYGKYGWVEEGDADGEYELVFTNGDWTYTEDYTGTLAGAIAELKDDIAGWGEYFEGINDYEGTILDWIVDYSADGTYAASYPIVRPDNAIEGVWAYDEITIFGADGEKVTYPLNTNVLVVDSIDGVLDVSDVLITDGVIVKAGDLVNYQLDKDGKVVVASIGDATTGNVGQVFMNAFGPDCDVVTNANGYFANGMRDAAWGNYADYQLTAESVVFEITTNADGTFKSVALGDAADYIGTTTEVAQHAIFAAAKYDVNVFYVVDAEAVGTPAYGLFNSHRTNAAGEYFLGVDGTVLPVANGAEDRVTDGNLVFAAYLTMDGKVNNIYSIKNQYFGYRDIQRGDFLVLINKNGYQSGHIAATKAIMLDLIKDAAYVSDEVAASVLAAQINSGNVADDVQYIDMTNGGASFELGTSHAADYEYIYVVDKYNELIMAFKVVANVD